MNKIILMTIVSLCTSVMATSAAADYKGKRYYGVQYASAKLTYTDHDAGFDVIDDDTKPKLVVARLGEYFSDNFALEVRAGTGVKDGRFPGLGSSAAFDVNMLLGLYGVNHFVINDLMTGYGLAGITRTKDTSTFQGIGAFVEYDSGLSFGVGVDFKVNDTVDVNAEYVEYLHGADFVFSALNIGAVVSF